jgi:hypothetical protein
MEPVSQHEYELHKQTCGRSFDEIIRKLDAIDRRLFKDNGMVSVQTQIRLNSEAVTAMKRVMWMLIVAVIGTIVSVIAKRLGG